jgi:hypothetical protein
MNSTGEFVLLLILMLMAVYIGRSSNRRPKR